MSPGGDLMDIDGVGDITKVSSPNSNCASPSGLSSSEGSRRSSKRKASFEEEDFMKRNPELYGLRRSVCLLSDLGVILANSAKGSFATKPSSGKQFLFTYKNLAKCLYKGG